MALKPGEDTIGTCRITDDPETGTRYLRWSIKLPNGKVKNPRTQAPKGTTNGALRAKARAKAAELLRMAGTTGTWRPTSPVTEYIEQVSKPAVDKAKLRASSKTRYTQLLDRLAGTRYLGGYTIDDATKFRNLETAIVDIAHDWGRETGRQSRNVVSKYVLNQLIRDGLLTHNPLYGMDIDLGDVKTRKRVAGGQALTPAEYDRVLAYLLDQKPGKTDGLTLARSIRKRRAVLDLTLLQMATGLRISEGRKITWSRHVKVTDEGQVIITVTEDIAKTHRARTIPVLNDQVAARLLTRRNEVGGKHVIGAPVNPDTEWDRKNASDAVKKLYEEVSASCDVPLLGKEGAKSHVWRATLNTIYIDLPEVVRAAYFGHDASVNRASYTDIVDITPMVNAVKKRHLRAV